MRVLLFAPLLCALGVERPAEANNISLSCVADMTEKCLAGKIKIANDDVNNQYDILLGKGAIRLKDSLIVTTPNWLRIFGVGAGLTSIQGNCFPPAGTSPEQFYTSPKDFTDVVSCSPGKGFSVLKVQSLPNQSSAVLVLEGLSISNGHADRGAGIYNQGTLLVYESTIMRNYAYTFGGGIYHEGSGWLYLQDSTVNNNTAQYHGAWGGGGGLFIDSGTVDIAYSTIHDNWTLFLASGAGIANGDSAQTMDGSFLHPGGLLRIVNSTISRNVDGSNNAVELKAGGIIKFASGEVWLKSVTVTDNTVTVRPGPFHYGHGIFGVEHFYFSNSIIAKNGGGNLEPQCGGLVITAGGNLVGTDRDCHIDPRYLAWDPKWPPRADDLIGKYDDPVFENKFVDPLFEEELSLSGRPLLRDNGGTSCTVALRQESPAINKAWTGKPGAHPFACEAYDQRWYERNSDGKGCDVGAFEYKGTPIPSGLGCPNN